MWRGWRRRPWRLYFEGMTRRVSSRSWGWGLPTRRILHCSFLTSKLIAATSIWFVQNFNDIRIAVVVNVVRFDVPKRRKGTGLKHLIRCKVFDLSFAFGTLCACRMPWNWSNFIRGPSYMRENDRMLVFWHLFGQNESSNRRNFKNHIKNSYHRYPCWLLIG